MLVLGIETSCDETASALVRDDGRVIGSVVSSQVDLHRPMGGVVPEIASREHLRLLLPVIRRVLEDASLSLEDVDGIAVTRGPGLVGALLVGVQTAKSLAWALGRPVVGVHHLVGHMSAPFLVDDETEGSIEHPFVALVASGGHTSLFEVRGRDEIKTLGRTRDDAAGEALDKGAKLLGLGYPGGPAIEKASAAHEGPDADPFPRGLRAKRELDFSFSGLKTALAERVRGMGAMDDATRSAICRAYEEAVVDSLVTKSLEACRVTGHERLVVSGGVAANTRLRTEMIRRASGRGVEVTVPPGRYCTDNAAMIALAGVPALQAGRSEVYDLAASPYLPVPEQLV
jgi:N6-L-threonylcarbamoyladenine synthase